MQKISFADNNTFKFYFQEKSCFDRRRKLSDKVVTVKEELDGFDIDCTGHQWTLVDLHRLIFNNKECGNLKLVTDGGVLTKKY